MSVFKRLFTRYRGCRARFEDYEVETGYTNEGNVPYAAIMEFFALAELGDTHKQAKRKLKRSFYKRLEAMHQQGEAIPLPGSGPGPARFAPSDQIEQLRPFVDEFWEKILETSYEMSFVSNESRLSSWERYVAGGREALIERVMQLYGVDITEIYDEPISVVLRRVRDGIA